jgi:hypothetical protein
VQKSQVKESPHKLRTRGQEEVRAKEAHEEEIGVARTKRRKK